MTQKKTSIYTAYLLLFTTHLWKEHLVLRLTLELQAKGNSYKTRIAME